MGGVVFKKPGTDPTTDRGIRRVYEVGTKFRSTGKTWIGKDNVEWVELLSDKKPPGWLLIQGEGVGMKGLLLQKVEAGEEEPFIVKIKAPKADEADSTDE